MINFINKKESALLLPHIQQKQVVPLYGSLVPAGFPSPADDFLEKKIDLNEYMIRNQAATFLVRVSGDSMSGAGICDGDILVVDRSVSPRSQHIIVGALDGEFTVKRFIKEGKRLLLQPENPTYPTIEIKPEQDFTVWGVVTFAIHNL
jgi:DNA polymerase V